jgi:hypothetical protein
MQKKISEILIGPYVGLSRPDHPPCEPSAEEIERAVREKDREERGYQEHREELTAEWNKLRSSFEEYNDHERRYHARRIAFFVVNGWSNDPIVLQKDARSVHDGLHRLKAAKHMGLETVEVMIRDDPDNSHRARGAVPPKSFG